MLRYLINSRCQVLCTELVPIGTYHSCISTDQQGHSEGQGTQDTQSDSVAPVHLLKESDLPSLEVQAFEEVKCMSPEPTQEVLYTLRDIGVTEDPVSSISGDPTAEGSELSTESVLDTRQELPQLQSDSLDIAESEEAPLQPESGEVVSGEAPLQPVGIKAASLRPVEASSQPVTPEEVREASPQPVTPEEVREASPQPVTPEEVRETSPKPVTPEEVREVSPQPVTPEEVREVSPQPVTPEEVREASPQPVTPEEVKEASPQPVTPEEVREVSPQPVTPEEGREASPQPVTPEEVKEASPQPVTPEEGREASPQPVTPEEVKEASPQPVTPEEVREASPQPVTPEEIKEASPQPVTPEEIKEASPQPVLPPEEIKEASPQPVTPEEIKEASPQPVTPEEIKEASPQPVLPPEEIKEASPQPVLPPEVVKEASPQPVTPEVVKEASPQPVTPKETSPQPVTPKETSPQPVTPKETSPQPVTPKETSPQPVTPKETSPLSVTPKETSPQPVTPEEFKEVSPQPEVVKEASPQPVTPEVVKEASPQPVTPKETSPQPVTPKETLPQPVTPKETSPQPVTPKETSPQPVTPEEFKEVSPQPEVVKEASPQPVTPEVVVVKEASPQPVTPEEVKEASPQPVTPEEVKEVSPQPVTPEEVKESSPQPVTPEEVKEVSPQPVTPEEVREASPQPVTPEVVREASPQPVTPEAVREASPQPVTPEEVKEPEDMEVLAPHSDVPDSSKDIPSDPPIPEATSVQNVGGCTITAEKVHEHNPHVDADVEQLDTPSYDMAAPEDTIEQTPCQVPAKDHRLEHDEQLNTPTLPPDTPDAQQDVMSTCETVGSEAPVPELRTAVSPARSLLESSTASSAVGTDGSSTDPGVVGDSTDPGVVGDSPKMRGKLAQSVMVQGSDHSFEEDDSFHMSLATTNGEKAKKVKRQGSMYAFRKSISGIRKGVKRAASQTTRHRVKRTEEARPSLMSPVMTQDWDPTCLLEELYSDFQQNTLRGNASGESARYYGYLEKLPKNATKSSMMKGWKRRYFRVMDDKIFYYEERTSPKALGFVRLSISRITLIAEKNQIHIQEKGGQSMMVKARDKEDASGWHRALLLEGAHPTVSVPVSTSLQSDESAQSTPSVLIIDVGAASVRAGFARNDAYPEVFFPAVASIDSTNYEPIASGNAALLPDNRYGAHQVYPWKHSLRMDKYNSNLQLRALECIIDTIVSDLGVEAETTELILTLPPTVSQEQRNELVEVLFEAFLFAAICFQNQCLLSLYSYNTTSGVVVNIGDHIDVVPIIDGYTIEAGVSHLPHGGNAITESLSKLITMKGIRYFSETEMYIVRLVKEELCYVSQDFSADCEKCDSNPAQFTRATDLDRFQLPDHRKVVALDTECFKAPEGLFEPGMWGKDILGIQQLVWKALQACPIDQRKEMARNIYLSGGTTKLPGLKERLQKEVSLLTTSGLTVEVHTAPSQHHAAFLGASVLATLGSFQNYLITREEFGSLGFEALKKWSTI